MMVVPSRTGNGLADASLPPRLRPASPIHTRTDLPGSNPIGPNHELPACIVVRQFKESHETNKRRNRTGSPAEVVSDSLPTQLYRKDTEIRRQIASQKRFKSLVEQWIGLSIEHSRLTMQFGEPKAT